MTNPERDDALIAEKKRLADMLDAIVAVSSGGYAFDVTPLARAAALLRGDEPAKPDRYLEIWREANAAYWSDLHQEPTVRESDQAAAAVLRRHFEPSAEAVEAARFYDVAGSRAGSILARFVLSLQDETPVTERHLALVSDEQIKQIANRFLGWRLPEDFRPDNGISFEPEFNKEWNAKQGRPPQRRTPTGTNLFSYTQAEAMVRYMIDGAKGGS